MMRMLSWYVLLIVFLENELFHTAGDRYTKKDFTLSVQVANHPI